MPSHSYLTWPIWDASKLEDHYCKRGLFMQAREIVDVLSPELNRNAFGSEDDWVWINGQPLLGIRAVDFDDVAYVPLKGVSRDAYLTYDITGCKASLVTLWGDLWSLQSLYSHFYTPFRLECVTHRFFTGGNAVINHYVQDMSFLDMMHSFFDGAAILHSKRAYGWRRLSLPTREMTLLARELPDGAGVIRQSPPSKDGGLPVVSNTTETRASARP